MTKATSPRTPKRATNSRARHKFPLISEEMKGWSAMLQGELNSWPTVATKSMFGFVFFYRRGMVFAALPRTRGFDSPSSLIFKLPPLAPNLRKRPEADSRMTVSHKTTSKGWFAFELHSESDLRDALFWLHHAYEAARR
jgi:hypothetical protein